jgi:hypothetical protein
MKEISKACNLSPT